MNPFSSGTFLESMIILTIKYIYNILLVASQSSAPQRGIKSNSFLTESRSECASVASARTKCNLSRSNEIANFIAREYKKYAPFIFDKSLIFTVIPSTISSYLNSLFFIINIFKKI